MNTLLQVLNKLSASSVLVVGDVMLDVFNYGSVDRISPEAPIPVLKLQEKIEMLGGAGNVVSNLHSLGVNTSIIGVVGRDNNATKVKDLFKAQEVDFYLLEKKEVPTITKTRFVAGFQQILRTDKEEPLFLTEDEENEIVDQFSSRIDQFTIVVLSDYKKGLLSQKICASIIAIAREKKIPVFVDPKGKDFNLYSGATLLKPNLKELQDVFSENVRGRESEYARKLVEQLGLEYCLVTLGKDGALLVDKKNEQHFHSIKREVFDVSGAGDTVLAALASSFGSGASIEEACALSNIAGGIVVSKSGTSSVTPFEIERELSVSNKVFSKETLLRQVGQWKNEGKKIGFTNGCFDILHAGHIHTLNFAKRNCDKLIVAVNTDSSVSELKGPERPINGEQERSIVLSELQSVDALVFFSDRTPEALIKTIHPDILVKGAEYNTKNVVGADIVVSYGGEVLLAPMVKNFSTTNIVAKIRED